MMDLLKDKKKIILAILICILAISLVYRLTHMYKQPKATALTYTGEKGKTGGSKAVRKDIASSADTTMVNLDMFLNPRAHSKEVKKNIFSGQAAEAQEKPATKAAIAASPANEQPPASNLENQIKDDLSEFKSFGYAERNGQKILFIEKGKQIMLIRKGDRIEGKYIVKEITQKELTLQVVANNEIVHIDLGQL